MQTEIPQSKAVWSLIAELKRFGDPLPGQTKKTMKSMRISEKIENGESAYFLTVLDTSVSPRTKTTLNLSLGEVALLALRCGAVVERAEIKDDFQMGAQQ